MHKPEIGVENKIHWDFVIKTDLLILTRRPDLV